MSLKNRYPAFRPTAAYSFPLSCQHFHLVLIGISFIFRVTAGYVLSLGTMMFIVLCDVQLRLFSDEISYRITLACVGVIALGCTGMNTF